MGKRAENGFKRESFVRMQTSGQLEELPQVVGCTTSQDEVSSGKYLAIVSDFGNVSCRVRERVRECGYRLLRRCILEVLGHFWIVADA